MNLGDRMYKTMRKGKNQNSTRAQEQKQCEIQQYARTRTSKSNLKAIEKRNQYARTHEKKTFTSFLMPSKPFQLSRRFFFAITPSRWNEYLSLFL
jgi:hypothetical protein